MTSDTVTVTPDVESKRAAVAKWTSRIRKAREFWSADFKRMREDMEFAYGIQWADQTDLDDDRYCVNIVNRLVAQKVASLYARNPQTDVVIADRLYYSIWDGNAASIESAYQASLANPYDVEARALLMDYANGNAEKTRLQRVADTLRIVYDWFFNRQEPEIKTQMKSLVQRVITCGVGYVRLNFTHTFGSNLTSSATRSSVIERAKLVRAMLDDLVEGEFDETDARYAQLQQLMRSLHWSATEAADDVREFLTFDFPSVTSIIVDPRCRSLRGFVGANFIAQQYFLTPEEVNAFFEIKVDAGAGQVHWYKPDEIGLTTNDLLRYTSEETETGLLCVWEVFDRASRTSFFICDGYPDYLTEPEPVWPYTHRFWPFFALTFNSVEVEDGVKARIFPPSDVRLARSAQKEWIRVRDALRRHREANIPRWCVPKGLLSQTDRETLQNAELFSVVELEGLTTDRRITDVLTALPTTPIQAALYDVTPLIQDMLWCIGAQEASMGIVQSGVTQPTATGTTIAAQAQASTMASNNDDLDDFLSDIAKAGGEMLLRELTPETAQRIAGPGASWPSVNAEDFVNEIFLRVRAASSGRPALPLDMASIARLLPQLLAAKTALTTGLPDQPPTNEPRRANGR